MLVPGSTLQGSAPIWVSPGGHTHRERAGVEFDPGWPASRLSVIQTERRREEEECRAGEERRKEEKSQQEQFNR